MSCKLFFFLKFVVLLRYGVFLLDIYVVYVCTLSDGVLLSASILQSVLGLLGMADVFTTQVQSIVVSRNVIIFPFFPPFPSFKVITFFLLTVH